MSKLLSALMFSLAAVSAFAADGPAAIPHDVRPPARVIAPSVTHHGATRHHIHRHRHHSHHVHHGHAVH